MGRDAERPRGGRQEGCRRAPGGPGGPGFSRIRADRPRGTQRWGTRSGEQEAGGWLRSLPSRTSAGEGQRSGFLPSPLHREVGVREPDLQPVLELGAKNGRDTAQHLRVVPEGVSCPLSPPRKGPQTKERPPPWEGLRAHLTSDTIRSCTFVFPTSRELARRIDRKMWDSPGSRRHTALLVPLPPCAMAGPGVSPQHHDQSCAGSGVPPTLRHGQGVSVPPCSVPPAGEQPSVRTANHASHPPPVPPG